MTDLEMQIIQMVNELNDEGKEELLKYGKYLQFCARESCGVSFSRKYREDYEGDSVSNRYGFRGLFRSSFGDSYSAQENKEPERKKRVPNEWWLQAFDRNSSIEDEMDAFGGKNFGKLNNKKIKWIILDKNETGRKILVMSRYSVDARRFDESEKFVEWANSSIRKWLNEKFYSEVFKKVPDGGILITRLEDVGTEDKIFLLSADEVGKYLNHSLLRKCIYGNPNDRYVDSVCAWWLRSNTGVGQNAGIVSCDGDVGTPRDYNTNIGVRPAMWLDLDALGWKR